MRVEGLRLGSQPMEEVARNKVMDLRSAEWFVHSTASRRLVNILREGIITGEFAERIKKRDYWQRFDSPHNYYFISVFDNMSRRPLLERGVPFFEGDICIFVKKPQNVLTIEEAGDLAEFRCADELLIRRRISPREFMGIGVFVERKLSEVRDIALEEWSTRPDRALPIYNLSYQARGTLFWPRKVD